MNLFGEEDEVANQLTKRQQHLGQLANQFTRRSSQDQLANTSLVVAPTTHSVLLFKEKRVKAGPTDRKTVYEQKSVNATIRF